jgi:single-stranded DNA-binding protein
MSYAQITIVGRLGRDPETKMTSTGKQIVTASVAVGKDDKTQWYKIQAWDKTGEWLQTQKR